MMKRIKRRAFIRKATQTLMVAAGGPALVHAACATKSVSQSSAPLQFIQQPLPYSYAALEPYIDTLTMEIHYSRHHTAYVKNVNDAITAESIPYRTEAEFFSHASRLSAKARNNGGGAWNHNFFWQIMKPGGGSRPSGRIADALNGAFGSFEKFQEEFTAAAMGRFGSGWAWLVRDGNTLKIGSTPNQDNPLMDISDLKGIPLLALDVWEHAYYLKYQNRRNEYIANWWNVVNWDAVAERLR